MGNIVVLSTVFIVHKSHEISRNYEFSHIHSPFTSIYCHSHTYILLSYTCIVTLTFIYLNVYTHTFLFSYKYILTHIFIHFHSHIYIFITRTFIHFHILWIYVVIYVWRQLIYRAVIGREVLAGIISGQNQHGKERGEANTTAGNRGCNKHFNIPRQ